MSGKEILGCKKDNSFVNMANTLTKAAHNLTLQEKRLLMLAVSKLDSRKPAIPENMAVELNVTEFFHVYGLTAKSTYNDVKTATEQLMSRYIRFKNGNTETRMQWVGQADYIENEGTVTLHFWYKLAPMLFELEREFTSYKLSRAGALRSNYAWRLFELLMQFKKTGYMKITVDEFHYVMETPKSLRANFSNLRIKVIEPAIKELKNKDGLKVTWKPIKTGRKVTSLEFKFPPETQTEIPNLDNPVSEIDNDLVSRYVSDNPELTRGKTYRQIIQQLQEVYPKAKVTAIY